jgi:DNA topoisomerase VI subunit B
MTNTTITGDQIVVQSHVARDLIQNAALFKNEKLVVWEYVSNGLDYIDEGTNPEVSVLLDNKKKRIVVIDNGRGMNWADLQNFFVMHGENIDRKKGRPGRGRFGTGKSAAFGIADILRVTTIRNSKRFKVELQRQDIETMDSLDPIPVKSLERGVKTTQANGTMVEIEGIHLKSLDQAGVIHYIERHLAKWRNASVMVNNHVCEFTEPPVSELRFFHTEGSFKDKLGEIQLVIKVASAPIEEELRGVSIFAKVV